MRALILAAAVLAVVLAACAATTFLPRTDATVYLSTAGGHGSGVVVAEGWVLTAAHVAQRLTKGAVIYSDGTVVLFDKPLMRMSYAGLQGPAPDFAVVALDTNGVAPVEVRCEPVATGEEVWTVGSPGYAPFVMTKGYVASTEGRLVSNLISATPRLYTGEFYLADLPIQSGSSGGPVYDNEGRLIGITTATIGGKGDYPLSLVQKPEAICAFLGAHGVL